MNRNTPAPDPPRRPPSQAQATSKRPVRKMVKACLGLPWSAWPRPGINTDKIAARDGETAGAGAEGNRCSG